jgi:hypothetical protein
VQLKLRLSDGGKFVLTPNTRTLIAARELALVYFERYHKDRYETVVETCREIQSYNIEFVMKRLRDPKQPQISTRD